MIPASHQPPEEWRDVPSLPGYQASSTGRIRREGRVVKPWLHPGGRLMIYAKKPRHQSTAIVARIVGEAFSHTYHHRRWVRLLDGDEANTHPDNILFLEPSEFIKPPVGEKQGRSKLTADQVREIRRDRRTSSLAQIAATYGVSSTTIQEIVSRHTWKHLEP